MNMIFLILQKFGAPYKLNTQSLLKQHNIKEEN